MQNRIAIAFSNTLGNLMFLSTAIKILRKRGFKKIDLITDLGGPVARRDEAIENYGRFVFDDIKTEYNPNLYDRLFYCGWSMPACVARYLRDNNITCLGINWNKTGVHEVQVYFDMIGADWTEFDGYIFSIPNQPELPRTSKIRIALANASGTEQALKKAWPYFDKLSKELIKLGFEIILVGLKNELTGCKSHYDFRGKLSIFETGKVLQQCDLLIASSTGITVISDAVKTPILLIEGPMFTNRAHPVQSKYDIVRRFVACSPCFQTAFWSNCKVPVCMNDLKPSEVIRRLFKFLPKIKEDVYIRHINYKEVESVEVFEKIKNLKRKCAYFITAFNRYNDLKRFIESFKNSNLLPGVAFILNDGSYDPRIKNLLQNIQFSDIDIRYFETDFTTIKEKDCKIASVRTGNILFDKMRKCHDENFDYMVYNDSDIIFKPYWLQRSILAFEEAQQKHCIWGVSAFNNLVDYFDKKANDSQIYENEISKYRLRGGLCINFIVLWKFFMNDFGNYNINAYSSDLSKSAEFLQKGYKGMVMIPSMIQHIGVFASSFRNRTGVFAEDF